MRFVGADRVVTRVICVYSPVTNEVKDSGAVYQQHRRFHINKLNNTTCPRRRFQDDLLKKLKMWRADGEWQILCIDANENIYHGNPGKKLTNIGGLAMREVVGDFSGKKIGATHFQGSEPINAVWVTGDIEVENTYIMPVGYGVGDHRLFIVDFRMSSMVGADPTKIIRPALCRLNTKIAGCNNKYNHHL
jgi:hypothetical protein